MSLTVCIPVHYRHELLYNSLSSQISAYSRGFDVQLMKHSNRGEHTIGEIRQMMLEQVTTPYVTFIDADDRIHQHYFKWVFKGIEAGAKGIGFKGQITTNGQRPCEFIHSMKYTKWSDAMVNRQRVYYRPLNHLNPILTDIAKQIGYTALRHGEDLSYSNRLVESGLIKKEDEYFIDGCMYYYLYKSKK